MEGDLKNEKFEGKKEKRNKASKRDLLNTERNEKERRQERKKKKKEHKKERIKEKSKGSKEERV